MGTCLSPSYTYYLERHCIIFNISMEFYTSAPGARKATGDRAGDMNKKNDWYREKLKVK